MRENGEALLLSPPCVLRGIVVHGKGVGHRYGMPTANLRPSGETELPAQGVYGGCARVDGEKYLCVVNIGPRPTADALPQLSVEALLLDFAGDLYGRELTLELGCYLREIRKFPGGMEELRRQIAADEDTVRGLFSAAGAGARRAPRRE